MLRNTSQLNKHTFAPTFAALNLDYSGEQNLGYSQRLAVHADRTYTDFKPFQHSYHEVNRIGSGMR